MTEIVTIRGEGEILITSPYHDDIKLLVSKARTNTYINVEELEAVNERIEDLVIKNNTWFMKNSKRLVEQKKYGQEQRRIKLAPLFWVLIVSNVILLLTANILRSVKDVLYAVSLPVLLTMLNFFNMYQFISVLVVVCATILIKVSYARYRGVTSLM